MIWNQISYNGQNQKTYKNIEKRGANPTNTLFNTLDYHQVTINFRTCQANYVFMKTPKNLFY